MDVYLIDGTYELFRHYYALPSAKTKDGREVAAVRGVVGSVLQLLNGVATHVAVATDHVIESFRNQLWSGYKTGEGIDPDLLAQFSLLEDMLAALGVTVWPMVEFEADDALAAAAAKAAADPRVTKVFICTPDKDLAQSVRGTRVVQMDHALQTAEAARRAHQPRWMIATGLIHDLGKVLCKFGEPQWAVVGDTNPVGCRFSDKIVHAEFFELNPDSRDPVYSTPLGIYERGCGLQNVHLSWGHDEYLYHVVGDRLPIEARYMIRYHSFYAWHREGEYDDLCNDEDRLMLKWVRAFNRYDLYSKADARPSLEELGAYYRELTDEFFPDPLNW